MRTPVALAVACIATFFTVDVAAVTCSKYYVAKPSDKSCSVLSKHSGVSSGTLHKLNPSLDSKCRNIKPGKKLCIKAEVPVVKKSAKKTTTKKTTTKAATTKSVTTKATTKKTTTTTKKSSTEKVTTTATPSTTTATTTTATSATATATYNYTYGLTAQITDEKDFCIFLPGSPGNKDANGGKVDIDAIANSEKSARAFCTQPNANSPGALTLPVTFITSAHYYTDKEAGYTQVTGKFNPSAWELSNKDEGGQYDNHGRGSPPLSMCHGYKYYVNMIEPNDNTYCMRCCDHYTDCNAGRSAYGCRRIVSNGVYE